MNIVLLGYRGSGKTSIGKKLASELWKDFVDLDDATRARFNNQTIADIWAEHGEAAFRAAEADAANTPDALRGRIFAGFDMLWQLGRLVSLLVGGLLAAGIGIQAVYALGGALLLLAAAIGWAGARPAAARPGLSDPAEGEDHIAST